MVAAAFPVAKLGTLLLKQASKPIANFAKERAKSHPFFRKYVCMPPAQFYHWCEIKMKMWVMNLGKPVEIPKLNEAMAIELGANLLGETIIFAIAAGLLYAEYARGARKEVAKEEAKKQEMIQLQNSMRDLFFVTEKQSAQINELMREIYQLESKVSKVRPYVGGSSVVPRPPPSPPPPPPQSQPPPLDLYPSGAALPRQTGYAEAEDIKPGIIISALDYVTYAIPNRIYDNH